MSDTSQSIRKSLPSWPPAAHALFQRLALIGKGQFRTLFVQLLGDAPCQRLVVGQPHDQAALALHQSGHYVPQFVLQAIIRLAQPVLSSGVVARPRSIRLL
jgi:hypothetical protein